MPDASTCRAWRPRSIVVLGTRCPCSSRGTLSRVASMMLPDTQVAGRRRCQKRRRRRLWRRVRVQLLRVPLRRRVRRILPKGDSEFNAFSPWSSRRGIVATGCAKVILTSAYLKITTFVRLSRRPLLFAIQSRSLLDRQGTKECSAHRRLSATKMKTHDTCTHKRCSGLLVVA